MEYRSSVTLWFHRHFARYNLILSPIQIRDGTLHFSFKLNDSSAFQFALRNEIIFIYDHVDR